MGILRASPFSPTYVCGTWTVLEGQNILMTRVLVFSEVRAHFYNPLVFNNIIKKLYIK